VTHDENRTLPDLLPHEWSSVIPLCAVALLMGVFPAVFLKPMEPAVTRIVERLQNTQTLRVKNEMQNAKFKMQTIRASQQVGEQRDGVHPIVP
jgi:hypothetical protein